MLTIKDYATLMRVNARTVRRWIKAGKVGVVTTPSGRKRIVNTIDAIHIDVKKDCE